MKDKVFYLCDRRKCQNCQYPTCKHTNNVLYADNFYMQNGGFWEKDINFIKDKAKRKAHLETLNIIDDMKDEHCDDEKIMDVLNKLESDIKELLNK